MNKRFILMALTAAVFSTALLIIKNVFLTSKHYIDIECTSTYTRNAKIDHSFHYSGLFALSLNQDGVGELTIEARSDTPVGYNAYRSFNFDYYIDESNHIHTNNVVTSKNTNDNVSDDFFKKYYFDLGFDGNGQIRIFHFKNIYIFTSPTIIIDACT